MRFRSPHEERKSCQDGRETEKRDLRHETTDSVWSAENHGDVRTPETVRVNQSVSNSRRSRNVWDVVKIAIGIRHSVIDGRRN